MEGRFIKDVNWQAMLAVAYAVANTPQEFPPLYLPLNFRAGVERQYLLATSDQLYSDMCPKFHVYKNWCAFPEEVLAGVHWISKGRGDHLAAMKLDADHWKFVFKPAGDLGGTYFQIWRNPELALHILAEEGKLRGHINR